MKEFKLPELGENITSASVLKVSVKPGDFIKTDQTVLEIETDKATIEVPSTVSGKISEVLIKEGENAKVGAVILRVEDSEALPAETLSPAAEAPKPATNAVPTALQQAETPKAEVASTGVVDFILPELGENIVSADILKVLVKAGDIIEKEHGILEIETDKATIEVPSTVSGKVIEVFVKDGEKVKVGSVILKVEGLISAPSGAITKPAEPVTSAPMSTPAKSEAKPAAVVEANKPVVIVDSQPPILKNAAPAAPSVRRLAREIGVDINQVPGSGPGGRISLDDVKAFSKKLHLATKSAQLNAAELPAGGRVTGGYLPLPDFTKFGSVDVKPMSNIRMKTADHLSYAWQVIPHVTQFDKADVTALEEWRKQYTPYFEIKKSKLTVTAVLVKIITSALKVFPQFNSSIDMVKKEIVYKNYFNVGIAVDTEHGLIVPVIKNADRLNIFEISQELNTIAEKARNRKVSLEDLQGGCITITNLGGIGGTGFTPIVNSPEVAILGVSRSAYEQVYVNGKFETRLMLPLSLSYDHRIIDGADGIRFLRWIIEALQNPMKVLIEG
ncbi:MAG: dihydrolipoyllysine-residue acetyltransferase [Ignavibacteriaceae bacterium]